MKDETLERSLIELLFPFFLNGCVLAQSWLVKGVILFCASFYIPAVTKYLPERTRVILHVALNLADSLQSWQTNEELVPVCCIGSILGASWIAEHSGDQSWGLRRSNTFHNLTLKLKSVDVGGSYPRASLKDFVFLNNISRFPLNTLSVRCRAIKPGTWRYHLAMPKRSLIWFPGLRRSLQSWPHCSDLFLFVWLHTVPVALVMRSGPLTMQVLIWLFVFMLA